MSKREKSLHFLGRAPLRDQDREPAKMELFHSSDRAAALIAFGLTDMALTAAVASHFVDMADEKKFEEMFYGKTAILGTAATRTTIGFALGIYGKQARDMLDKARRVRNVFAHSVRPLTFAEEEIKETCELLPPATLEQVFKKPPKCDPIRGRYVSVCLQLQIVLNDHADRFSKIAKVIDIPDGL